MINEDEKIYPPLTEQEFNDGTGFTFRGVPICEDEEGMYLYAYGHVDKETYAKAVNEFHREMLAYDSDHPYTAEDVKHVWAVSLQPADGPDGWFISWASDVQDHPLRFPMTVVDR